MKTIDEALASLPDSNLTPEEIARYNAKNKTEEEIKLGRNYTILETKLGDDDIKLYVALNKTDFNLDWNQTLQKVLTEGDVELTLNQFRDYVIGFKEFLEGKKKIYYADGSEVDKVVIENAYEEIFNRRKEQRWRAEHLDAKFDEKANMDGIIISYGHRLDNGVLKPLFSEEIPAKISKSNGWFNLEDTDRKTGLVTNVNNTSEEAYFYAPITGRVSRFGADSGGAYFSCNGFPGDSYDGLGVRRAKILK